MLAAQQVMLLGRNVRTICMPEGPLFKAANSWVQQHSSAFSTTSATSSSEGPSSSSAQPTPSTSSAPSQQQGQDSFSDSPSKARAAAGGIRTVARKTTRSGYKESVLPSTTAPQQLKVKLREDDSAAVSKGNASRSAKSSLYQGPGSISTDDLSQYMGVHLDKDAAKTFSKLVGGLTKMGKKSLSKRIVLDSMRIMKKKLDKGETVTEPTA